MRRGCAMVASTRIETFASATHFECSKHTITSQKKQQKLLSTQSTYASCTCNSAASGHRSITKWDTQRAMLLSPPELNPLLSHHESQKLAKEVDHNTVVHTRWCGRTEVLEK